MVNGNVDLLVFHAMLTFSLEKGSKDSLSEAAGAHLKAAWRCGTLLLPRVNLANQELISDRFGLPPFGGTTLRHVLQNSSESPLYEWTPAARPRRPFTVIFLSCFPLSVP